MKLKSLCLIALCVGCAARGYATEPTLLNDPAISQCLSKKSISVVAPASGCSADDLKKMQNKFPKLVVHPDLVEEVIPYHANIDAKRLQILKQALNSPHSSIVWNLRGGYGSARLIDQLSRMPKPKKQKLFIGYSDITALHLFLSQKWGWTTIHGPMMTELLKEKDPVGFRTTCALINKKLKQIKMDHLIPMNEQAKSGGVIKGLITGGNLTLIENSLGTSWQIQSAGKILLLEDVNTKGYQVDRMLVHLQQTGIFNGVKAVIFGDFEADAKDIHNDFALRRFAKTAKFPVFKTNRFGHGFYNVPFVYNSRGIIKISESTSSLIMNWGK